MDVDNDGMHVEHSHAHAHAHAHTHARTCTCTSHGAIMHTSTPSRDATTRPRHSFLQLIMSCTCNGVIMHTRAFHIACSPLTQHMLSRTKHERRLLGVCHTCAGVVLYRRGDLEWDGEHGGERVTEEREGGTIWGCDDT